MTLIRLSNLFAYNSPVAYAYIAQVQAVCRQLDHSQLDTCVLLVTNAFSNDEAVFSLLDIAGFVEELLQLQRVPPSAAFFCYHYCKLTEGRADSYASMLVHKIILEGDLDSGIIDFTIYADIDYEYYMILSLRYLDDDDIDATLYKFILICLATDAAAHTAEQLVERLLAVKDDFGPYFQANFRWGSVGPEQAHKLVMMMPGNSYVIDSFFEGLCDIQQFMSHEEAPEYLELIAFLLNELETTKYIQAVQYVNGFLGCVHCDTEVLQQYVDTFMHDYGIDLLL